MTDNSAARSTFEYNDQLAAIHRRTLLAGLARLRARTCHPQRARILIQYAGALEEDVLEMAAECWGHSFHNLAEVRRRFQAALA
jgi:hypothetical protein